MIDYTTNLRETLLLRNTLGSVCKGWFYTEPSQIEKCFRLFIQRSQIVKRTSVKSVTQMFG